MNDARMALAPSWRHTAWVVGTFACCVVFAGHGAAPIGSLLVLGWNDSWILEVITGWLAIIALVLGPAVFTNRIGYVLAGALLSVTSWALFMLKSGAFIVSLAFSAPYLATLILWIAAGLGSRGHDQKA